MRKFYLVFMSCLLVSLFTLSCSPDFRDLEGKQRENEMKQSNRISMQQAKQVILDFLRENDKCNIERLSAFDNNSIVERG